MSKKHHWGQISNLNNSENFTSSYSFKSSAYSNNRVWKEGPRRAASWSSHRTCFVAIIKWSYEKSRSQPDPKPPELTHVVQRAWPENLLAVLTACCQPFHRTLLPLANPGSGTQGSLCLKPVLESNAASVKAPSPAARFFLHFLETNEAESRNCFSHQFFLLPVTTCKPLKCTQETSAPLTSVEERIHHKNWELEPVFFLSNRVHAIPQNIGIFPEIRNHFMLLLKPALIVFTYIW